MYVRKEIYIMSYFSFPHTRTYDDDLGFLIEYYNEVKKAYDGTWARINELADYLETNLPTLTADFLNQALNEGRIMMRLQYQEVDIDGEKQGALSFNFYQGGK